MGKRKRTEVSNETAAPGPSNTKKARAAAPRSRENWEPTSPSSSLTQPITIQVVTGSYDRILHGITATITPDEKVEFADTFLFNAHTSAIRCLALSPPSAPEPGRAQKVMLASGSSDERINVYNISAYPPSSSSSSKKGVPGGLNDVLSSVAPRRILENPRNRELGTLLHHSASVTRLAFPARSKLLSAAEDSTVAVARTRDWAVLSSIRTPAPRPLGRPSGDTAALGAAPRGVNDFAVHPSMKLMITVGRGERCMRLWNLMTARKAGVLNFGRDVLRQVGEGGRGALGEGRRVVWGRGDDGGDDEFCVAFDRDLLVFGMDSTPKCRVMPDHRSKVHEVCYVATDGEGDASLLAVSTEDGRIMFFSTKSEDLTAPPAETSKTSQPSIDGKIDDDNKKKAESSSSQSQSLPVAKFVAYLGGKEAGVTGRIKDFAVLRAAAGEGGAGERLIIPTGSSDGRVRVFSLAVDELSEAAARKGKDRGEEARRVGRLLGTYDTSNRITCLEAFVMIPRPEGVEDSEDEDGDDGFEDVSSGDDDDDEDDEQ
ncbi:hypothetical protein DL766_008947 [Monosporascus sp. MC13-8B]|nr:hypothetical protein DL763_004108 [Monosporascus cannonballus]RYP17284.1 hypothetical protein DL766_008947 [Monosporascus sp. MC13-8B]